MLTISVILYFIDTKNYFLLRPESNSSCLAHPISYSIFLPEKNVLGVTSVLLKNGNNFTNIPSAQEFLSTVDRWYEVQALAENKIKGEVNILSETAKSAPPDAARAAENTKIAIWITERLYPKNSARSSSSRTAFIVKPN